MKTLVNIFKINFLALLVVSTLIGCNQQVDLLSPKRFEEALERFAETVLEFGRDRYGEEITPLFVDGLNVKSLEPASWQYFDEQKWVTSNFASQQALMRFLDGITELSGDFKYRKAAEQTAEYMLEHVRDSNGLLYWGGHTAWDLMEDRPVGDFRKDAKGEYKPGTHELKSQQPYYELMYRVNPDATRDMLLGIWGGHIVDWELLDFNRHAWYNKRIQPKWSHKFNEDIEIPFETLGRNLSFANAAISFINAGSALAALDENPDALKWTERLVYRWQQGKHPVTGLGGGQVSYLVNDRARSAFGHVHPQINEANMVAGYHRTRYHDLPLVQLQNGEMLLDVKEPFASAGKRFIEWALEDLRIYARQVYDPEKRVFKSLLTDGTILKWEEVKGVGGYYFSHKEGLPPAQPDGNILWSYSSAFRLTKDPLYWTMVRDIALGLGLGDIGEIGGKGFSMLEDGMLRATIEDHLNRSDDWSEIFQSLYALLDLYKATDDVSFLKAAAIIGDALVNRQTENGLFPRTGYEYARTGDEVPLALLHLTAAISGKSDKIPKPMIDNRYFHMQYVGELQDKQIRSVAPPGDLRTMDHLVFYGK